MNFNTETLEAIQSLILAELEQNIEASNLNASDFEQGLRDVLQHIGQNVYGDLLSKMDEQQHGVHEKCPQCGQAGKRISKRPARVLSVFGWSEYRRSYYQCSHKACGHRWFGLDESESLRAGQATPLMGSLLGLAGITVSFEEAVRQIKAYLQVSVSANTLRQETIRIGEKQAEREAAWRERSKDLAYLQERERNTERPQRIYGSIDGAFAPLTEGWKEAKTICWYQEGFRYGEQEPRAMNIHYYTSLESAEEFGELLWATGVQHQADQAEELVFVCDGATWIWKLASLHFPQDKQIVDWYHASQYLHAVAEALPVSQPQQQTWLEEMKEQLWEGEVETVMNTCQSLLEQAGEPVSRLLSYYGNNIERMRYGMFRTEGYFIGSGTVESACKQIVAMRLKRAGARWTSHGATMTAKARTAWLSNTWEQVARLPLAA